MLARINAFKTGLILAGSFLAILILPQFALAVSLGEIQLQSSLNEPLDATIPLSDLGDLDETQITVGLGSPEDFAQVELEFTEFMTSIEFEVDVDLATGTGTVHLTSTENVAEPFLNFVVSASWPPNGRLLREYTLLVDLPDLGTAPAPAPATTAVTPATTAPASGTYTVGGGDTLYQIARATRPDASIGIEQMMLAIQRANADAFVDNNINRIRSGRVLRIPTLQEIAVVDQQAAIAQVNAQNQQLAGQPLALNNSGAGAAGPLQDELSVLTDDDAQAAAGSSDLEATIAALENQLMLSEENLDRARLENLELTNQLSSLQEEIDLLENIIAIEDERIAQLQNELATQAAATTQALAQAQASADALNALDEQGQPGGFMGLLQNSMILFAVLLALVLAAVGVLVMKKRRAAAEAEDHAFDPAVAAAPAATVASIDTGPAKAGFLAGLLARFRRQDEEDEFEDDTDPGFPPERTAYDEPQPIPVAAREDTGKLLNDLGIQKDLMNLDEALDDIDDSATEDTGVAVAADDIDGGEAPLGVSGGSAYEEVAQMSTQASPAEAERMTRSFGEGSAVASAAAALDAIDRLGTDGDSDESTAIGEAAAAAEAPVEVVDFKPVGTPAAASAIPAPIEDAETFEFTLRDVNEEAPAVAATSDQGEEIESFDFRLREADSTAPVEPAAHAADELEMVSFNTSAPAADNMELGDFSFDDTMLADEEESPYTPRTGDECDTKLDLATAYEAMGDVDDAIEILNEVIAEGNPAQVEMAQRLKQSWQSA